MLGRKPGSFFNSSTLTQDFGELWQTSTGKLVYISVRKKPMLLIPPEIEDNRQKRDTVLYIHLQLSYKYLTNIKMRKGQCSTFLFFPMEQNSKWKLNFLAKRKPITNTTHFLEACLFIQI